MWNFILHAQKHAFEIDSDYLVEVGVFRLGERLGGRQNSRIVKGTVQCAESFHGGPYKGLDRSG
jgi:hypothetical protein